MTEHAAYTIHIFPDARSVPAEAGETLLSALRRANVFVDAPCGGSGTCGKCAVALVDGGREETVLACRVRVDSDMTVRVPEAALCGDEIWARGSEGATSGARNAANASAKSAVHTGAHDGTSGFCAAGAVGTADTAPANAERDTHAHNAAKDPQAARPMGLERSVQTLAGYADGSAVSGAKQPARGDERAEAFGFDASSTVAATRASEPPADLRLAFDIGTTTIAGYLLDAESGAALTAASAPNPQRAYGADVISRCAYAAAHGVSALAQSVRGALNELARALCRSAGTEPDRISAACVVGNTCMHHLFLGLSPAPLATAPYRPAVTGPFVLDAALFGLNLGRGARLIVPPVIAGFVGSDTVGCLVASGFDRLDGAALLVDVGTNGELALSANGRRAACSAAAGPAFEGANIRCGMRAARGAIREVAIADGDIVISTVGGEKPLGVCGSGLIDAAACMLDLGVLDASGRILSAAESTASLPPAAAKRLVEREDKPAFLLAETGVDGDGVYISQADVRELQLAKAAIAAGIALLMKHLDIETGDIRRVLFAGAFGNALSPKSAARVGLIPWELLGCVEPVGNAAGVGACQIVLDERAFLRAAQLARATEHLELSGHPAFEDTFVDLLAFPESES